MGASIVGSVKAERIVGCQFVVWCQGDGVAVRLYPLQAMSALYGCKARVLCLSEWGKVLRVQ
jgi:hypothetical protein